ncbi:MAG TPA: VWA domain-containing protein, partial [Bryobacteraceae bacterium]|nr:VWA domain-containing protein [Bryobacteraceae bacterium]
MSTRTAPWIPLLCLSLSGFAQQSPSPDQRMTLDVAVTDKSGKPVTGLEQKDFSVLDNKQPQKIESFAGATAAEPAVQFIFVSDEVNTSFSNVSYERAQIEKFLRSNSGKLPLPASLAFVSDAGLKLDSVTTEDGNALATELAKNQNGLRSINRDQGVYGAGERVEISLNALRQLIAYETPRPGRKLVIWLGPGWPFLTGPNINLSDNDQKGIFGQVVAISDGLRRARMTLYSVDPLGTNDAGSARTFYYREFVSGVKNAGHAQ